MSVQKTRTGSSVADGAMSVALCHRQVLEIALGGASGCGPLDAFGDIAAGRLWSEKVEIVVGYTVVHAVAECPIYDSIPGSASFVIGGSFSEVVGDPSGRLVCNGCELVAMPVVGFSVQVHLVDGVFTSVTIVGLGLAPGF
jgi:hypothetical protein